MSDHRRARIAGLWSSEALGALGTQVAFFALPLAAVTVFGATALQVGVINSLESVAALAFGLLAGVLIDRLGGARAVVIANLTRALSAFVLAAAIVSFHEIALLYVAALLLGIGGLLNEAGCRPPSWNSWDGSHANSIG
ncbi:MAG: rane protein [Microbacteriaceae bacterium]|nr:rane protein [Microbacteriaceae bacterium]